MKRKLALIMPLLLLASVSLLMVARTYAGEEHKFLWPPGPWVRVYDPGNPVDRNGNGYVWRQTQVAGDGLLVIDIDDLRIPPGHEKIPT